MFTLSQAAMKANRSLTTSRRKKGSLPFYEVPSGITSAKIIEEARKSVRALPTERPFTPADSSRILFGNRGSKSRPPSVYRWEEIQQCSYSVSQRHVLTCSLTCSIGAHHFSEERLSRPPTGQCQNLAPIERTLATDTQHVKVGTEFRKVGGQ